MEKGFARVREGEEEFYRQKKRGNRVAARYGNRIKNKQAAEAARLSYAMKKSTKFEARLVNQILYMVIITNDVKCIIIICIINDQNMFAGSEGFLEGTRCQVIIINSIITSDVFIQSKGLVSVIITFSAESQIIDGKLFFTTGNLVGSYITTDHLIA